MNVWHLHLQYMTYCTLSGMSCGHVKRHDLLYLIEWDELWSCEKTWSTVPYWVGWVVVMWKDMIYCTLLSGMSCGHVKRHELLYLIEWDELWSCEKTCPTVPYWVGWVVVMWKDMNYCTLLSGMSCGHVKRHELLYLIEWDELWSCEKTWTTVPYWVGWVVVMWKDMNYCTLLSGTSCGHVKRHELLYLIEWDELWSCEKTWTTAPYWVGRVVVMWKDMSYCTLLGGTSCGHVKRHELLYLIEWDELWSCEKTRTTVPYWVGWVVIMWKDMNYCTLLSGMSCGHVKRHDLLYLIEWDELWSCEKTWTTVPYWVGRVVVMWKDMNYCTLLSLMSCGHVKRHELLYLIEWDVLWSCEKTWTTVPYWVGWVVVMWKDTNYCTLLSGMSCGHVKRHELLYLIEWDVLWSCEKTWTTVPYWVGRVVVMWKTWPTVPYWVGWVVVMWKDMNYCTLLSGMSCGHVKRHELLTLLSGTSCGHVKRHEILYLIEWDELWSCEKTWTTVPYWVGWVVVMWKDMNYCTLLSGTCCDHVKRHELLYLIEWDELWSCERHDLLYLIEWDELWSCERHDLLYLIEWDELWSCEKTWTTVPYWVGWVVVMWKDMKYCTLLSGMSCGHVKRHELLYLIEWDELWSCEKTWTTVPYWVGRVVIMWKDMNYCTLLSGMSCGHVKRHELLYLIEWDVLWSCEKTWNTVPYWVGWVVVMWKDMTYCTLLSGMSCDHVKRHDLLYLIEWDELWSCEKTWTTVPYWVGWVVVKWKDMNYCILLSGTSCGHVKRHELLTLLSGTSCGHVKRHELLHLIEWDELWSCEKTRTTVPYWVGRVVVMWKDTNYCTLLSGMSCGHVKRHELLTLLSGMSCGHVKRHELLYLIEWDELWSCEKTWPTVPYWVGWVVVMWKDMKYCTLLSGMSCGHVKRHDLLYLIEWDELWSSEKTWTTVSYWVGWVVVMWKDMNYWPYWVGWVVVKWTDMNYWPYWVGWVVVMWKDTNYCTLLSGMSCGHVKRHELLYLIEWDELWSCEKTWTTVPYWVGWVVVMWKDMSYCTLLSGMSCGHVKRHDLLYLIEWDELWSCEKTWTTVPYWVGWVVVKWKDMSYCILLSGMSCGHVKRHELLYRIEWDELWSCEKTRTTVPYWVGWVVVMWKDMNYCTLLSGMSCGHVKRHEILYLIEWDELWSCEKTWSTVPYWVGRVVVMWKDTNYCTLLSGMSCGHVKRHEILYLIEWDELWSCEKTWNTVPYWVGRVVVMWKDMNYCTLLSGTSCGHVKRHELLYLIEWDELWSCEKTWTTDLIEWDELWSCEKTRTTAPYWVGRVVVMWKDTNYCTLLSGMSCDHVKRHELLYLIEWDELWSCEKTCPTVPYWVGWVVVMWKDMNYCTLLSGMSCGEHSWVKPSATLVVGSRPRIVAVPETKRLQSPNQRWSQLETWFYWIS